MTQTQAAIFRRTLQESINQIHAVYASSVVLGFEDEIEEIHVMAGPSRPAKLIVRDIESLLMVKFHLRVDYRKISLVQAEEEKILQMLGARPRLVRVVYREEAPEAVAEVLLDDQGTPFEGRAKAPLESAQPEELAAQAALQALTRLSGEDYQMRLASLSRVDVGERKVLLALVTLNVPGGEESLLGTAFVRDRPEDAGARAALDAVNRRLTVIRNF